MPISTASAQDVADLIQAVGSFAWPVAAVVIALIFREELKALAKRVSKATILGQDVEFEKELDRLESTADKLPDRPPIEQETVEKDDEADRELIEVLREAAESPQAALMVLSADLERRLRRIAAAMGKDVRKNRSARHTVRDLEGSLPANLRAAVEEFFAVRNQVAHGAPATERDVLRALDVGLEILRAVDEIPVERNFVEDPSVPLYTEPELENPMPGVHGVLLRTVSPESDEVNYRIFPSTQTHFGRGKQVSWEWNFDRRWGPAWYRDPLTSQTKLAWHSSVEFVGRHLDEL